MKKFENDWTSTVDAMRAALEGRQSLIDRMVTDNVLLIEALRKLLLAVLAKESAGWGRSRISLEPQIEQARAALETAEK